MKKIISVLLACVFIAVCAVPSFAAGAEKKLSFNSDGTFTILHLTDSQDDHYPAWDMLNLIKLSIEEADPDLIIFTGDIVEDSRIGDIATDGEPGREGVVVKDIKGDIIYDKTLANIEKAVDAQLSILEASGVPYVICQGNNDHKCGITNEDWLKIYSKYPNCLVVDESDDAEGRIDYNLFVYGSDGTPKFNIWCMDTGRGGVNPDQTEWYKNRSAQITAQNGGQVIPAFVFQHIYVDDIGNLFEPCESWDEGAEAIGAKFYRLNRDIARGNNFLAYEPGATSAEFVAWKESGDVIGAFFGHQHTEGFSGVWQGIELGFTYGCEFAKTGPYGCRVLTLHEDDILNYDNEQYVYSGRVKLGTDKLSPLEEKEYPVFNNGFEEFFNKLKNLMLVLVKLIKGLVA